MFRRVLIISSTFYPVNAPGAHRMAKFAKYLPEFGWTPVVLCPRITADDRPDHYDPSLLNEIPCETIQVSCNCSSTALFLENVADRIVRALHLQELKLIRPWRYYRGMLSRADQLLARERFDTILATRPSPKTLAIANKMWQKYRIPWIADFRDIAGELEVRPHWFSPGSIEMRLEAAQCKSAAALVSVSPLMAEQLALATRKRVHCVYNGFEPNNSLPDFQLHNDYFSIVYCGRIVPGRDPSLLLDALDTMIKEKKAGLGLLRLRFYGLREETLRRFLGNRPCAKLVENMGRVSFEENLRVQRRATILLLLSHPNAKGILTSKIFEYFDARRPILSVPADGGAIDAILSETQAGMVGNSQEEIAEILQAWLEQWETEGYVEYKGLPNKIQQYTRSAQTQRLAQIFDDVCKS